MPGEVWRCGQLTYKVQFDTKWLLVFQHNTSYGAFTRSTALLNFGKGKFSYLSRISDPHYVKRYNESYEFLLEYPIELPGGYNHWIQAKDPLSEADRNKTGLTATDFKPVNLSWGDGFGGLMSTSHSACLLDGQTGIWNWNYAIGHISSQYISDEKKSPGPIIRQGSEVEYIFVTSIYLWLRISSPTCILCTQCRKLPHSIFQSCFFILITFS